MGLSQPDWNLSFLHRVLPRVWAGRGLAACVLWPVSLLFWCVVRARAALYALGVLSSARVGVPVVVVGNVTAGGSGKTPVVIALCERLRAAGLSPGVVSRGYGGRARGVVEVGDQSLPVDVGDEPVLIARRTGCPVFVGRRRVDAARALLARHPEVDVLVADDGLQHLALGRDVEIVVMDERGVGNGWMMPAGPLREPVARLSRVDAIVMNGAVPDAAPATAGVPRFAMRLAGASFYCLANPQVVRSATEFSGGLHAVAGIGHPARFFEHLAGLGLAFSAHPFPDHHAFVAQDLVFNESDAVLMTEKDAVKCAAFAREWMWVLRVDAQIEPDLMPLILEWVNGRKTA